MPTGLTDGVGNNLNTQRYTKLIEQKLQEAGFISYGLMDVFIERCRGRAEIMRCGMSDCISKSTQKYRAGEPLSDIELQTIYQSGLRRMRYQAFVYIKSKLEVVNDKAHQKILRG